LYGLSSQRPYTKGFGFEASFVQEMGIHRKRNTKVPVTLLPMPQRIALERKP
jgi:hypothetical protein